MGENANLEPLRKLRRGPAMIGIRHNDSRNPRRTDQGRVSPKESINQIDSSRRRQARRIKLRFNCRVTSMPDREMRSDPVENLELPAPDMLDDHWMLLKLALLQNAGCRLARYQILTPRRDAARAFSARSAFQLAFRRTRAIRCGRRPAYRCARKCAHRRNRVALGGDSLEAEQSDNCRNTPMRHKMQEQVRRI
jgi:hypothetical protein